MADTQIYNYDHIQRYLQHQMTPQEMHDFEKALMNDPFLADALEGFLSADAAITEKHLSKIENVLTGKIPAGKVVRMPLQKTAWWKVAAAILVVVAGGALTYLSLIKTGNKENIVQQKTLPKPDSVVPAEEPLSKSENLPQKDLFDEQKNTALVLQKEEQARAARRKATSKDDYTTYKKEESIALSDKNSSSATTFNPPVIEPDKPAVRSKKTAVNLAQQQNDLKNKITGEKDHINETALVYEYNNKRITSPDEYFALKNNDSMSRLQATATGYFLKGVRVKSDTSVNVILNKTNQPMSDLDVTSAIEKKRKQEFKNLQQKPLNDAEPIGGWENFEQYLNRQTDSLKANDYENQYSKNIEIEFFINNDGQPTNIKAMENTDSVAAVKAVQILANGPKWKSREKDKKVKIVIRFE